MFKRLTPVLAVESVEPSIEFWKRLGFDVTIEVAHGERLGFVCLARDGVEIMYQSRASLTEDFEPAARSAGTSLIYVQVDDLAAVEREFGGIVEVLVTRRKTFYGATETVVREPGGHLVTFAQF